MVKVKVVQKTEERKAVAKKMTEPNTSKKVQRLVADRNLDRFKGMGYKVVGGASDAKGKVLGVRTHTDLVLMEK